MNSTPSISILVVDDHPVVRDGINAILSTQTDFLVVGEAANGMEAVQKAGLLRPDVVLLDLEMPEADGIAAIQALSSRYPQVRILVFTAFDTDERIVGAVEAGAQGYLLKGAPRDELFQAIRVVSRGGSLLQPVVASRLLRRINARQGRAPGLPKGLTEREMQVLVFMAQGKPNKEIASALSITPRTVKFHVSSILSKLSAGNRTEAVRLAVQHGLVKLE